ncbi:MAG: bifunctional metallophosphatase/5'-nucleotidase [Ignavibacteriales bacterium]|nr:bifunctional metallophosphatase/5'-nucleotidase [Ignavibacteriales bacterium]
MSKSKLISCSLLLLLATIGLTSVYCQPKTVTILHTNDMHSAFLPHEAGWVRTDPKPFVGGFVELNYMIDSIKKEKKYTLLLDGGDVMTGNPIAEMEYQGAFGGALFNMMNMLGYEGWTIGNHDLDISQDNLKKLTKIAKFPTLSANLVDSSGNFTLNNKDYVIINKNDIRIGIIGIMSKGLFELTNTNNLRGLKVLSPIETLQKVIDKIDPETDLIIALTHQGVDDDSVMATKVHDLDLIIGSHSHTRLKTPKIVNNVIIAQTGANCENLGEIELSVENDKVISSTGKLHTLWLHNNYPQSDLIKFVDEWKEKVNKDYNTVIGKAAEDLRRSRSGESSIGHFIADAIREETQSDIGFTNSSGIRKDILAGDIRKIDIFEVAPFRNYLCTFQLKGSEVRKLIERYVKGLDRGRTSIDISGVECSWAKENDGVKIISLKVNNKDLVDENEYKCGTIDYVVNQADRYLEFIPENVISSENLLYNSLVKRVIENKVINNVSENRFKMLK